MSTTFADLGVPGDVVARLGAQGITEPFPIQTAVLVDALAGRDLCGRAPTGSGKTLAFGIPLVAKVGKARPRRPRGLVLVPTRELATQVYRALQPLAAGRGREVAAFYGGVGYGPQLKALVRGVDVVVATPGRLMDLIDRRAVSLAEVDFVVIDEADRMADMGFLPPVRKLLDQVAPERQTLLFSATLDGDVDVLVRQYQRDPARHELAPTTEAPRARHAFWRAEPSERVGLLAELVPASGPTIVFCRTRHGADRVAKQLGRSGVAAEAIHGGRSQSQRERTLAAFTRGRVEALIATDVAARGIHVDGVGAVVHFDVPADAKDYLHRSGRTARAGATGAVVSLVGASEAKAVAKMQSSLGLSPGLTAPSVGALAAAEPVEVALVPTPASSGAGRAAPARSERRRPNPSPASARPRAAKQGWAGGYRGAGAAPSSQGRPARRRAAAG